MLDNRREFCRIEEPRDEEHMYLLTGTKELLLQLSKFQAATLKFLDICLRRVMNTLRLAKHSSRRCSKEFVNIEKINTVFSFIPDC